MFIPDVDPAAKHCEIEVQVTPLRLLPAFGAGEGTIDQKLPFHSSINVTKSALAFSYSPTAQHWVAEEHVTASNSFGNEFTFGDDTIDQEVPFHCSISV
jgi:hypothetical protein